jgi:hypothetical protein
MYGHAAPGLVKTGIVVYPNPAKGILNLSIAPGFTANSSVSVANPEGSTTYEIRIANIMGSVIKEATITQQNWQTDVTSFMPGTYVIQVINQNNSTVVGQATFIKL